MDYCTQLRNRLYIRTSGEEACAPGHCYGPAMRDYYLMHIVISGRGVFQNAHGSHPVQAGQGFMIFPGEITVYTADSVDPWHYAWVGFSGDEAQFFVHAAGLSSEQPLLGLGSWAATAADTIRQIYADASLLRRSDVAAIGGLYRLLALIAQDRADDIPVLPDAAESYRRAMWFINANFQRSDMHIEDVARFVNLSRSQLFRIFKAQCSRSPQQVVGELRLNRACRLLSETSLTLKAIAISSGYATAAHMGEVFQDKLCLTPLQYRQNALSGQDQS